MFHIDQVAPFSEGDFESLIRHAFGPTSSRASVLSPPIEISVDGSDLVVSLEVPGMTTEDLDITVEESSLVVQGERRAPEPAESKTLVRSEMAYGRFRRSFRLPRHVDPEAISAICANGVLTIRVTAAAHRPSVKVPVRTGDSSESAVVASETVHE